MGWTGALGDGEGKWRLVVGSDTRIRVMSLLENAATGHLTNLSSVPGRPGGDGVHHVPLFPSASDPRGRQGFGPGDQPLGAGRAPCGSRRTTMPASGTGRWSLPAGRWRGGALQLRGPGAWQRGQGPLGEHRFGGGRLAAGVDERSRHRGALLRSHGGRLPDGDARHGGTQRASLPGRHVQPRRQPEPGEPAAPGEPIVEGCGGVGGGYRRHRRGAPEQRGRPGSRFPRARRWY